jgi:hypothetical protein
LDERVAKGLITADDASSYRIAQAQQQLNYASQHAGGAQYGATNELAPLAEGMWVGTENMTDDELSAIR